MACEARGRSAGSAAKLKDRPAHRHVIGMQLRERILKGHDLRALHPLSLAIRQRDGGSIFFVGAAIIDH